MRDNSHVYKEVMQKKSLEELTSTISEMFFAVTRKKPYVFMDGGQSEAALFIHGAEELASRYMADNSISSQSACSDFKAALEKPGVTGKEDIVWNISEALIHRVATMPDWTP